MTSLYRKDLEEEKLSSVGTKENKRSSPQDWLEQSWLLRMPEILTQGNSCTLKAAAGEPGTASREERKELGLGKEAREDCI